ncbi:MaoC/PaaZ C-terminal domain-containing protein [Myceligenerans crystallogenes]|uniref:MaoC/PaaZ C-terminal domain-containing protein n=1 Tax=Myceligenerans crystallogenes TaxID=316335 RepID=UPI0031DEB5CF
MTAHAGTTAEPGGADGSAAPASAAVPYPVTDLADVPALGGLYVKGVAGSVTKRPGRGVVLPPVTYRVADVATTGGAAQLAAYQRVVGEPSSDVLPAGFLHVLAFPLATAVMVRPDFPLGLLGMVHLRNVVRVPRPVRLGERLEIRAWAENARPHRRGVQVDMIAEVLAGGELAYRGVSTYLAKGFRVDDAGAGHQERVPAPWAQPLPTARWRLGKGIGPRYAAVSGDRNPIHMSVLGARALGFPRAIAHGMYTAARALAEVGPARRGDAYEWSVEFFQPVLLPGSVDVAIRHPAPGDAGYVFDGWRTGRPSRHFSGTVTPL